MTSAEERYQKRFVEIGGLEMAYVEEGAGDPIVLLHGNPSSSYQWRNVIPHLTGLGRCIAPDLIGMGDSAKLSGSGPESYRLVEHRKFLDALLETLDVSERVTLVLHDWGSALGFDWAYRNPSAVRGIAYMEAFVATIDSWSDWPAEGVAMFQAIRSDAGEAMVLGQNFFVEKVLPTEVLRGLSEAEMKVYRRPYLDPGESRRPTLSWPRQVPVSREPQRRLRHHSPVRAMARPVGPSEALHRVRPRRDVREPPADRQVVAQPDAHHCHGRPFRPGGRTGRDRSGDRRLAPRPSVNGSKPLPLPGRKGVRHAGSVRMFLPPGEPAAGPWRVAPLEELLEIVVRAAGDPVSHPRIVAVDGRGASGKSTLAKRLAAAVLASAVVSTDEVAWHHSFFGWTELLATGVLQPGRRGEAVSYRPPAWRERGRPGAIEVPAGRELLIVEGVGAGRRELAELLDAVVWVQSDFEVAERRGIARDLGEGVNGDEEETVAFWHEWMAEELVFLAQQRPWERACVVVAGTLARANRTRPSPPGTPTGALVAHDG